MPKVSKSTSKKSKVATPAKDDEDPDLALSESEAEEGEEGGEESGEEDEEDSAEEESEEEEEVDEADVKLMEEMTEEDKLKHKAKLAKDAETRRKTKARRRGLRKVATLAGFSTKYVSDHPDRDVSTPVLSLSETIRAAKWAPRMANKPAFEGLAEFTERCELAYDTSLPPGAAAVLQTNGEVFLRRLVLGAVQRQADMSRTSTTAAMVAAETRPLKRALKYSFVGTDLKGLVRYAQTSQPGDKLSMFDGELNDIVAETGTIIEEQKTAKADIVSKAVQRKKEHAADKKAASKSAAKTSDDTPPAKKKKKVAVA